MGGLKLRIEGYSLTSERVERRLAAVLAADVAGYSCLMGTDEEGTLARLKAVRKTLVDPSIAAHRGRIVKTTGDGVLVEFASAVDAARSAIEVQRGMAERNADYRGASGSNSASAFTSAISSLMKTTSSATASTLPRDSRALPSLVASASPTTRSVRFAARSISLSSTWDRKS
jgi:class 3 adenylate cyclase